MTKGKLDSTDEILMALKNMGHDITCGSCMEIAFTGVTTNKHTCREEPWEESVQKTLWKKLPKVFYLELLTNKVYNELAEVLFELQRGDYETTNDERKQLDILEAAGALKCTYGGMWNGTLASKYEKQ